LVIEIENEGGLQLRVWFDSGLRMSQVGGFKGIQQA
jgi:hypothetical protein